MKQPTQAELLDEDFGPHPRCCVFCRAETPTQDAFRIHVFDTHGDVVDAELPLLWKAGVSHQSERLRRKVFPVWEQEFARHE